jgi:hypothetical protein
MERRVEIIECAYGQFCLYGTVVHLLFSGQFATLLKLRECILCFLQRSNFVDFIINREVVLPFIWRLGFLGPWKVWADISSLIHSSSLLEKVIPYVPLLTHIHAASGIGVHPLSSDKCNTIRTRLRSTSYA